MFAKYSRSMSDSSGTMFYRFLLLVERLYVLDLLAVARGKAVTIWEINKSQSGGNGTLYQWCLPIKQSAWWSSFKEKFAFNLRGLFIAYLGIKKSCTPKRLSAKENFQKVWIAAEKSILLRPLVANETGWNDRISWPMERERTKAFSIEIVIDSKI